MGPSKGMIRTLKCIIKYVYENTKDKKYVKYHLVSLLANVFHGTSCLQVMTSDIWNTTSLDVSRGIIQITGKESYKLISEVSGTDYVANPEALAHYTESATINSLKMYSKLLKYFAKDKDLNQISFLNTMEALKLKNIDKVKSNECPSDIKARIEYYQRLCQEFGVPYSFSS